MKKHRFLLEKNLELAEISSDDRELINQLLNVLRLKIGEEVLLFDGLSNEVLVKIDALDRGQVIFRRIEKVSKSLAFNKEREVVLYCAILKKENFETVVQKATEIGVTEIIPLITDCTVKFGLKDDRLNKIIKEASEQSGRLAQLKLKLPMSFAEAIVEATKNNVANIIFDQSGRGIGKLEPGRVGVFVGPEGGWTPFELAKAQRAGFALGRLGGTTLRAETASIVASFEAVNNF